MKGIHEPVLMNRLPTSGSVGLVGFDFSPMVKLSLRPIVHFTVSLVTGTEPAASKRFGLITMGALLLTLGG